MLGVSICPGIRLEGGAQRSASSPSSRPARRKAKAADGVDAAPRLDAGDGGRRHLAAARLHRKAADPLPKPPGRVLTQDVPPCRPASPAFLLADGCTTDLGKRCRRPAGKAGVPPACGRDARAPSLRHHRSVVHPLLILTCKPTHIRVRFSTSTQTRMGRSTICPSPPIARGNRWPWCPLTRTTHSKFRLARRDGEPATGSRTSSLGVSTPSRGLFAQPNRPGTLQSAIRASSS